MLEAAPVSQARLAYWKEREVRWKAFVAQHGPDYIAFGNAEKPFVKAAKEKEKAEKKAKKPKPAPSRKPAALPAASPPGAPSLGGSCPGGKKPKMTFGTVRCASTEEISMSDIINRMRQLAGIDPTLPGLHDDPTPEQTEEHARELDALARLLDPVITQVKKAMSKAGSEKSALSELLNAAVHVRKMVDGD